ncbi:MAG TPA: nitroreductase family protein [Thermodesulfovibrionales bacterium]|nr:nitroreductase family protein [Thermodesulfovibrionales bacterium]
MDVIQAIRERRSINFFEPGRDIPAQTIRGLLELANLAPSSMNLQPWRVIVVDDPDRKKTLRQCAFDQPKVEEASAVLIMVADPQSVEVNIDQVLGSWVELGYMKPEAVDTYRGLAGKLYGTVDGLTRKFFAIKNTSLYGMSVMIAAKGLGLETHPMDGFDEDAIKQAFSIPQDKIIPMLIAVGYLKAGVTLLPRAYRRNIEDFMTMNSY